MGLADFSLRIEYHCMYMIQSNLLSPGIPRCEESTSSLGVSNSIGEGIIEEDEDEEGEAESNKKRMKEDDQEVLSLLLWHSFVC